MPEQQGQDKTEPASEKKRQEERDKGNVAKSSDLNAAIVLLVGILAVKFTGGAVISNMASICTTTYRHLSTISITPDLLAAQSIGLFSYMTKALLPLLIFLVIAAFGSNYLQVGFMIAHKALVPNFSKLNVISGIKQMFSVRSMVETLKGLLKIIIIGFIGFWVVRKHIPDFLLMSNESIGESLSSLGDILFELTLKVGIALLVLAIADFVYQRYQYEESIKMTKQEKQDENKQYEGNPEVKRKIRSNQLIGARKRMLSAVPDATVVVTNPTHLAIALKYDMDNSLSAPTVVAKGKRKIAERIKAIALEHAVPIIENKPLARTLFATTEVGMEIPAEFYQAVAEILAQIYRQNSGHGQPVRRMAHAV
ncbi:MAG: flagellar biosynthesis protein FlhB [FCB group bacterium]|nr:flagellar biosynthesis protein FlhB [FCB group bacterium]